MSLREIVYAVLGATIIMVLLAANFSDARGRQSEACREMYARARTNTDTLIVDGTTLVRRYRTCWEVRQGTVR